jgi:hypothetical protein
MKRIIPVRSKIVVKNASVGIPGGILCTDKGAMGQPPLALIYLLRDLWGDFNFGREALHLSTNK